ncbi:hypothetical protein PA598K_01993 [Paenibacillus sp. 598K]|uniref:hypothetical protein n=1 Tax=Paenibacillus sp. 598K TaxID=1117987 RepID=UPI000FFA0A52|nr:hypothetical protein [Paenibacillus sp. 598K]GBF73684.1 hypothetical protein PA598K_01993 [Paenibacillus sp. 598K]
MSRVQNSGFYKLLFLMTPEQVQRVVELLAAQQARFHQTNYGQQQDEVEQVLAAYAAYYRHYTAPVRPEGYRSFVYSVVVTVDGQTAGYAVRGTGLAFPDGDRWAQHELPYVMLSLPKGYRMDEADGEHYRYEDIRVHLPQTYALYEQVAAEVKRCTRPLRFLARGAEGLQEQKPAVRISPEALSALSEGWLWQQYGLVVKD